MTKVFCKDNFQGPPRGQMQKKLPADLRKTATCAFIGLSLVFVLPSFEPISPNNLPTYGNTVTLSSAHFSFAASAAAVSEPITRESLEKQLQGAKDQARVDLLNQLADLLISVDLEAAVNYADEAIGLSKTLGYTKGEIDAMNHLGYISLAQDSPQDALLFFSETSDKSAEASYMKGLAFSKNGFGIIWSNLGDYAKGLDSFEEAEKLFSDLKDDKGVAFVKNNMGTIYESMGLYDKAIGQYQTAFSLYERLVLKEEMAVAANNLGSVNKEMNRYDQALAYFTQALDIHTALGYDREVATELNNIGDLYATQNDPVLAEESYNKALDMATALKDENLGAEIKLNLGYLYEVNGALPESIQVYNDALATFKTLENFEGVVSALNNIGGVYAKQRDPQAALKYHMEAYEASQTAGYREGLKTTLKQISSDYQAMENYEEASHYLTLYTELVDTLQAEQTAEAFANSEVLFDTEKKSKEILNQKAEIAERVKERNRLLMIVGIIAVSLLLISVLLVWVARERRKSEKLLLNILPKKVANELKRTGKTVPERFESCTVYFSDIANFTTTSEALDPVFLIDELSDIFTTFDAIMERYGCERIKTIGDAYMAVCGLPEPVSDHAVRMVNAAKDILIALDERNQRSEVKWRIRIGINSGQIVGGVVGVKKYIYDVFGDTINTASRMESNSEPMRINISKSTFEIVSDTFDTTARTPIEVKGKGLQEMYFIEGPIHYSDGKAPSDTI